MAKDFGKAPPAKGRRSSWVQTERSAHEAWARLIRDSQTAARLAHVLVANMDASTNALVASQTTLAELMAEPGEKPMHRNTVREAIKKLEAERWIEVVKIGRGGGALAYVINDRVAWGKPRGALRYSRFSAKVVASSSEQTHPLDDRPPLRQVPTLMRGEQQLPTGDGEDPPSQPSLDGMEPRLPEIQRDDEGNQWEIDPDTGEAQQLINSGGQSE